MPGPLEKPLVPSAETVVDEREAFETPAQKADEFLEQTERLPPMPAKVIEGVPATAAAAPAALPKDEVTVEVEKVLEQGLGGFYAQLPPNAKTVFRQKGEVAATEISAMVRSLNLQFKRALQLVRDWLLTIPGVNRFFLEQEAKIKVDQIKDLIEARREDATKQP